MSKNIAIMEGTTGKQFSGVKKIQINNLEGGSSYWVPEDETKLGTRNITEDGTYIASEEVDSEGTNRGWYGYEKVTVNGIGKAVYTAKEGDQLNDEPLVPDEDYSLDENGATILPDYLDILRQPFKVRYYDGEEINPAGAIVKAYTYVNGGELWTEDEEHYPEGNIPYNELILEPDKAKARGDGSEATSDLLDFPISFSSSPLIGTVKTNEKHKYIYEGNFSCAVFIYDNEKRRAIILADSSPSEVLEYELWDDSGKHYNERRYVLGGQYTYQDKTVYWSGGFSTNSQTYNIVTNTFVENISIDFGKIAWTMIYGHVESLRFQDIEVYWKRPVDKKKIHSLTRIRIFVDATPPNDESEEISG